MKSLQISQDSNFLKHVTEKVDQVRKSEAKITIAFIVIFISLPIFLFLYKNSKFHVFEPFHSSKTITSLQENSHNTSSKLLSGISDVVTPLNFIVDKHNNFSKPSKINSNSISDAENQNISSNPSRVSSSNNSFRDSEKQNDSSRQLKICSNPNSDPQKINSSRIKGSPIRDPDELYNLSKPSRIKSTPISDRHKFVDQLIASSFDKQSCISRYQLSSYQKDKPYKPSPYLISKVHSYEELHARCGPQSFLYKKTIKKLSKSNYIHDNETLQCKYLVWTPANGLGNRMLSMVSAFLYSILQNRVLLVEFEAEMDGLFCEPFHNSTWLLPQNFPHRNHWSQLPTFETRANSGETEFLASFLQVNIQHGKGDNNIQHFHCNETHSILENIPVLILLSDQYFVPSLFYSPSYKEELNRMFPEKDAVFHHLGHYLFNPSNEAWGLITRFYQAYLANADEKIGLQIRIFSPEKVLAQDVMSQILACTQSQNILPTLDNTASFLNSTLQNSASKSKAILVASLYPEYADNLRSMYWTKPTVNGDVIGVYQPSHEEFQKFRDNIHNMKALAEIYLLSLCDVLVTTPRSTFGYVAQSLGGLKPWIMVSLGRKKLPNPPCKRGFSMEPCFHVPPKYDCKGESKIDNYTKLYPHLRPCDDVWWGVKLFDTYIST